MDTKACEHCGKANPASYKYCSECGYELPKAAITQVEEPKAEKGKWNNKNKVVLLVSFAVAFILFFYVGQHFATQYFSIDKNMLKMASALNESCPVMVDSETRLDNTMAMKDKVFTYYYTLVNIDKNEVDPAQMKATIQPRIINIVSTNPDMQAMRDLGVTFKYSYKDKNGVFLFEISVGPDQYQ